VIEGANQGEKKRTGKRRNIQTLREIYYEEQAWGIDVFDNRQTLLAQQKKVRQAKGRRNTPHQQEPLPAINDYKSGRRLRLNNPGGDITKGRNRLRTREEESARSSSGDHV